MSSIEVLENVRRERPDLRVVIHSSDETAREPPAQLGAEADVEKGRPLDELADICAAITAE